jgi:hypothetical protein
MADDGECAASAVGCPPQSKPRSLHRTQGATRSLVVHVHRDFALAQERHDLRLGTIGWACLVRQ